MNYDVSMISMITVLLAMSSKSYIIYDDTMTRRQSSSTTTASGDNSYMIYDEVAMSSAGECVIYDIPIIARCVQEHQNLLITFSKKVLDFYRRFLILSLINTTTNN